MTKHVFGYWSLVIGAYLVLGMWLLVIAFSAQAVAEEEPVDWPATITRLQQEMHRHPGLARIRKDLAIAYNNYGVTLLQQRQWELAKAQMGEAIRLDSTNMQFQKNLANVWLAEADAYAQQQRVDEAKVALEQAISLDPELVDAYRLLGELEYNSQRLKEAKAAWERALELDPTQAELAKRLEQVTAELPVESQFERISQAYFDLRYEEGIERPVGFDLRDMLLQARREVGVDFAHWPKRKLVVLIYSAESFRAIRQQTPEWLAGQYDGKIRVPLPNAQLNVEAVKQILYHEYTHAVVHELTNGKCPTWFNEGLAEYEGMRYGPKRFEVLAAAAAGGQLVTPWSSLNDSFSTGAPYAQVALGYQQSHSIVRYLIERYGFWCIRRILKALAEGQVLDELLTKELHISLSRLQSNWLEWLPSFLKLPP